MIRRPPRSTRTENTLSLHDALPILLAVAPAARAQPAPDPTQALDPESPLEPLPDLGIDWPDPGMPDEAPIATPRSEEHTSELQSLMRISYAVFCLKKKK